VNGACKWRRMITLERLCFEVGGTGRHLTARAARDWWTKGLLPRPRRRGPGRGMGTETFWVDRRVVKRACAAHDLLSERSPAFIAIIGLWLWGFPVDLRLVRESYTKLIDEHIRGLRRRTRPIELDDAVGELAAKVAPALLRVSSLPSKIRDSAIDLLLEILTIFYGATDDPAIEGLADLLIKVFSYLRTTMRPQPGCDEAVRDFIGAHFGAIIDHLHNFGALPRQRSAMTTATDYELMRARRIIHLAFGSLMRLLPPAQREEFAEFGRRLVIVFGRPAAPIMVGLLRDIAGQSIIPYLLHLTVTLRRARTNPHHLRCRPQQGVKAANRG
jgi:hypothetical protein